MQRLELGLDKLISLDEQQQAHWRGIDGCRENMVLLDPIICSRYNTPKSLCLETVDMSRTFDNVRALQYLMRL